jgi:hypothetical protein
VNVFGTGAEENDEALFAGDADYALGAALRVELRNEGGVRSEVLRAFGIERPNALGPFGYRDDVAVGEAGRRAGSSDDGALSVSDEAVAEGWVGRENVGEKGVVIKHRTCAASAA